MANCQLWLDIPASPHHPQLSTPRSDSLRYSVNASFHQFPSQAFVRQGTPVLVVDVDEFLGDRSSEFITAAATVFPPA